MIRKLFFVLALCALASPAVAADAASTACATDLAAPIAGAGVEAPLFLGGLPDASEQSTCYARCANGSSISCWGTSCSAQDSQCSSGGSNGSCWGSSSGSRSCGSCPSTGCSATATCNGGGTVSCTGSNNDCFAVNGCYASCNGQYTWCPNLDHECPL